jgi:hypothetical protein
MFSIGSIFTGIWQGVVGAVFRKAAVEVIEELAEGLRDLAIVAVKELGEQGANLTTTKGRNAALKAIEIKAKEEGREFSKDAAKIALDTAMRVLVGSAPHPGK